MEPYGLHYEFPIATWNLVGKCKACIITQTPTHHQETLNSFGIHIFQGNVWGFPDVTKVVVGIRKPWWHICVCHAFVLFWYSWTRRMGLVFYSKFGDAWLRLYDHFFRKNWDQNWIWTSKQFLCGWNFTMLGFQCDDLSWQYITENKIQVYLGIFTRSW